MTTPIALVLAVGCLLGLPVANADGILEADALTVVRTTSGEAQQAKLEEEGSADAGAFTHGAALIWRGSEGVGAAVDISIPVERKGTYTVTLRLGKYRTFGIHQYLVNGKPVGKPIDSFGNPGHDIVTPFTVQFESVALADGDNTLTIRVTGTNDDTIMGDFGVCVDWIKLAYTGSTGGSGGSNGTGSSGGSVGTDPVIAIGSAKRFEADTLRRLRVSSGEARTAKLAEDGYAREGEFTGDRLLLWHDAAGPGATLDLALQVARKGRYGITARVARYRTYGIVRFFVNGKPVGKPVDMFGNPGEDIVTSFTVDLGAANLLAGTNRLTVKVVGTNPDTIMANHGSGVDWISIRPLRAGSTGATPSHR